MVEQGYTLKWHWVWNNGCASQLKNNKPWYFISRYLNLIGGCKMLWIFLEVIMAKDPKIGARVTIKRFIYRKKLIAKVKSCKK
jgi:hypothetical protein